MSAPLVSPSVLAAVRSVAETGLQTKVSIFRRSTTVLGALVTSDDYGDDSVEFTQTDETLVATVMGWFHSTPTPLQVEESGALVTVNTYRLFLPVGTDVIPGDRIDVVTDTSLDDTYTVSDTTSETTWQALLTCSLRKRD